jgi:hypothetical protein
MLVIQNCNERWPSPFPTTAFIVAMARSLFGAQPGVIGKVAGYRNILGIVRRL